ncbi:MAG: acetyl-CoA hydrolase, partial [Syntrophobacteraceae bacterium]|nr:acetyl-CoA hydrolase [Syntrophobacteraceae bacterium]
MGQNLADRHWKTYYKERLSTAETVLRKVLRDGNRIFIGSAGGEPRHLTRTLMSLLPRYRDLELVQNLSLGELPEDWSQLHEHCRLKTFFLGPRTR